MKYNLNEMTDLILSSIDGDEVDSINDTTESYQVALLIKGVYYDLATDLSLPEHETLFELNDSGDNTKPCLLTIPDNVTRMDWFHYDNQDADSTTTVYLPVEKVELKDFLDSQRSLQNTDETFIESMTAVLNGENFEFLVYNDRFPSCYTVIGDDTIICDAYNSDEDTRLLKAKTRCHGIVYPAFTISDSFELDLDPTQFSLLINRAKVRAFSEIKQVGNSEAALEARRQSIRVQKLKRRQERKAELTRAPKYGRK